MQDNEKHITVQKCCKKEFQLCWLKNWVPEKSLYNLFTLEDTTEPVFATNIKLLKKADPECTKMNECVCDQVWICELSYLL